MLWVGPAVWAVVVVAMAVLVWIKNRPNNRRPRI